MKCNHITGNTQFYVYLHRKAPLKANFKVCHLLPHSFPLPDTHPIKKMLEETSIYSSVYNSYPSFYPYSRVAINMQDPKILLSEETWPPIRWDADQDATIPENNSGSLVTEEAFLKTEKSVLPEAYYCSLVLDRASFQKRLSTRSCLTDERLPNFPGKMYRQHTENKMKCISSTSQAERNNWSSGLSIQKHGSQLRTSENPNYTERQKSQVYCFVDGTKAST